MELGMIFMVLIFGLVGFGGTILWIWMLIDCISNESSEGNDKLVWVLVIVLTQVLGALIYLIVRRPQRRATLGR